MASVPARLLPRAGATSGRNGNPGVTCTWKRPGTRPQTISLRVTAERRDLSECPTHGSYSATGREACALPAPRRRPRTSAAAPPSRRLCGGLFRRGRCSGWSRWISRRDDGAVREGAPSRRYRSAGCCLKRCLGMKRAQKSRSRKCPSFTYTGRSTMSRTSTPRGMPILRKTVAPMSAGKTGSLFT